MPANSLAPHDRQPRTRRRASWPLPGGVPGARAALLVVLVLCSGACLDAGDRITGDEEDDLENRQTDPPAAMVEVQGFPPADSIPNMAASVVAAPRPADERVRRFLSDLGAARIELVLSLAELNPDRSNYPFEDPSWRQMVRSVHSVGGSVLLRLSDVPRRLRSAGAGSAGPLAGPEARAEWEVIVREVLEHFAGRPETRIDELVGPRTPHRLSVWGPAGATPENGAPPSDDTGPGRRRWHGTWTPSSGSPDRARPWAARATPGGRGRSSP